jgi:hypothetical protein
MDTRICRNSARTGSSAPVWPHPSVDHDPNNSVGSIASSIVTGIVFSHNVTDSGMQMIGRILTAVSVLMLVLTVFDHTLKTANASGSAAKI